MREKLKMVLHLLLMAILCCHVLNANPVNGTTNPQDLNATSVNGTTKAPASPVVNSTASPVMNSTVSPVVNSTLSPLVNSTLSPLVNSLFSRLVITIVPPVVKSTVSPVVNSTVNSTVLSKANSTSNSTSSPVMNRTVTAVMKSTVSPVVNSTVSPVVNSTASSLVNSTASPLVNRTASPVVNSTASPVVNSTVNSTGPPLVNSTVNSTGPLLVKSTVNSTGSPVVNSTVNSTAWAPDPTCRGKSGKIAFMLHNSSHVGEANFTKVVNFTTSIINAMDIGPNATQIAAVSYDKAMAVPLFLNQSTSKAKVLEAVQTMKFSWEGEAQTKLGLATVQNSVFTTAEGEQVKRVHRVLVVVTNGPLKELEDVKHAAKTLKDGGVKILAIGVGGASPQELESLASKPGNISEPFHFRLDDYNALASVQGQVVKIICQDLWAADEGAGQLPEQTYRTQSSFFAM